MSKLLNFQENNDIRPKVLFIVGASRSGTTLITNLLDGHPDLLVFPTEHSTIENFFRNQENMEHYARNEFIDQRKGGQQTFLSNPELLDFN